jgi:glycosyltransferase involved in cell wall biosynthesis
VKIAHVTDFYLPRLGGVEMHVHDLAVRQQAAGHQVEIVTTSPGPGCERDLPVHRLTGQGWLPAELSAGRRLLRERAYDVVHVHAGPTSPLAFAAIGLAAQLPTVVTVHSLLYLLEPAFRVLDAGIGWSALPAVWTAVSQVAAVPLRRLVGSAPVHVLPNGIEAEPWRVAAHPPLPGELLVVAVMRLAARKRPLHLLRLLRRAHRNLAGQARLRAVIVGDGPLRGATERHLRRHDMTGWVELPGRLTRPQIKETFTRADVFVAPATLESFGIAALEARCAGLPVIARSQGGIGEFITDGREGLLVDSDHAMADAIVALAIDEGTRARIAAHNRTTLPPVSWPDVLARTAKLYDLAASHHATVDDVRRRPVR